LTQFDVETQEILPEQNPANETNVVSSPMMILYEEDHLSR
jgi:hypothetical protein